MSSLARGWWRLMPMAGLLLLLAGAVAVRAPLMLLPEPYPADVSTFWLPWLRFGTQHGLSELYQYGEPPVNYPPAYLALLLGLARLYGRLAPAASDSTWLPFLIKLPAVTADLAISTLLFALALRLSSRSGKTEDRGEEMRDKHVSYPLSSLSCCLLAASLWSLNPAVIYVSAYWGQVDSIPALWMIASVWAALGKRWLWAGVLLALGLLTKLQAVVLLPLLLWLAWQHGRVSLVHYLLGLAGTVGLGLLPFALSGSVEAVLLVYLGSVGFYPRLSLNAFNLWWPVQYLGEHWLGQPLSDQIKLLGPVTVRWVGLAALAAYALLLLMALRPRRSAMVRSAMAQQPTRVFFAAGMLVFGFFMLPTEIHERYILPALALLVPAIGQRRDLLAAYLLLSVSVFLNLLEVLPFAPWLYALLSALPGERLLLSLLNTVLFVWLTGEYLRFPTKALVPVREH